MKPRVPACLCRYLAWVLVHWLLFTWSHHGSTFCARLSASLRLGLCLIRLCIVGHSAKFMVRPKEVFWRNGEKEGRRLECWKIQGNKGRKKKRKEKSTNLRWANLSYLIHEIDRSLREREKKNHLLYMNGKITTITYRPITSLLYFIVYKILSRPCCNLNSNVPWTRWDQDNYRHLMGD